MGNVEDIRKALEEFVAPSLTELKTRVGSLEATLPAMEARLLKAIESGRSETGSLEVRLLKAIESGKSETGSLEARLLKAIEAAKTEILLMVRVSDLSARNAELEAKVDFLSKRTEQDAANQ